MSLEDRKLFVRRFYEEVVNTGDVELIDNFLSPEYCEIVDGETHAIGIEGAKAHILGVWILAQ